MSFQSGSDLTDCTYQWQGSNMESSTSKLQNFLSPHCLDKQLLTDNKTLMSYGLKHIPQIADQQD